VKSSYEIQERLDLNISNDYLESVWIEITNIKGKNISCAFIYRHPHDDSISYSNFLEYLESSLGTLAKENKEVYICGDFNSDLLKIEVCSNYKHFYNLLVNFGFFPCISKPTRIQGNTATVIDNIFSNTSVPDSLCGNILTDFSDHFSQFLSVKTEKLDPKKGIYLKRDYSTESSVMMFLILHLMVILTTLTTNFMNFIRNSKIVSISMLLKNK